MLQPEVPLENTLLVTGTGRNHRKIILAAALPAFHAQSGADNTGCFSGKGKLHAGKLSAFEGSDLTPGVAIMASIEKFVCQPCLPETDM